MHIHLARQMQQHLSAAQASAPELQAFLESVERNYQDFELDRRLPDEAMSADSKDLMEAVAFLDASNSHVDTQAAPL